MLKKIKEWDGLVWFGIICLSIAIFCVSILCFVIPYFNMRVYEKTTGIKVTYWEAVFTDLKPPTEIIDKKEKTNGDN